MVQLYSNPTIEPGSLVLVTGVNGLIASHIADQFLALNYKVRGTVRDAVKSAWVTDLFEQKYGPGKFELVVVKDLTAVGAFDSAVKGIVLV